MGQRQGREERGHRFQESRLPDRDRRGGQVKKPSFTLFRSTPTTEASPCVFCRLASVSFGLFSQFFWCDLSF